MSALTTLAWAPRWPPLPAEFALAQQAPAKALARLLIAAPLRLSALRGVVAADLLAVTGTELPWVPGVEYFGRDGANPWLLLPTHVHAQFPTSWLERHYRHLAPLASWPCLLVPARAPREREQLVPVGDAAALDAASLQAWCGP
jgi:hypothetical protein